jgi:hypothetical protein
MEPPNNSAYGMTRKILRSLTCFLFVLSTTVLLRADRDADQRNERIPVGHQMHPPRHKLIAPFSSSGPTGYTPQQLRHAYGFDQLSTTGAGQIIAIVDAYGSPTIQADLNTFCTAFGIPSTTIQVYFPQGQPAANSGWATETSLDVEWAHAIAPGATIALVASKSAATTDLLAAVDYAVSIGATQVSMSWGGAEYSTEASSDYHFNVPGVTFLASSGDSGAGAQSPACSPYVVGVGGTTLHLDASNNISSETAWSGSGGGASLYEPVPSYQAGWWSGATRGVPDVAYDADPNTGVPVYLTGSGWAQYGGTSMSAPQWAALFALANSLRSQPISSAPDVLYSLANANYAGYYHDITSGNNGNAAGPGYDLVTGLGTPLGNQLVLALSGAPSQVAAPVFSPAPGAYLNAQNVTITTATPGASIRYTTDGSTPTETTGTLYSSPVNISNTATLKALAYQSGLADSTVTSGIYTIIPGWALRDFNGDGKPDILWRDTTTGDTAILLMNGTTPASFAPIGTVPPPWNAVAVGDFNHDGNADILWSNATTGEIGVTLMNGTTITSFVGLGALPPSWIVAGLGDFNGDGQTDILLQNTSTGEVGFLALNGTTVTGFTAIGTIPSPWTIVGTGDFNGDGQADLLWYNPTTGGLMVSLMNGATVTGYQGIGTLPLPWTVAGTADFNGDGSVDLLLWNPTTGDTGFWLMNGTTPTSFVPLGNVPAPWQPID